MVNHWIGFTSVTYILQVQPISDRFPNKWAGCTIDGVPGKATWDRTGTLLDVHFRYVFGGFIVDGNDDKDLETMVENTFVLIVFSAEDLLVENESSDMMIGDFIS